MFDNLNDDEKQQYKMTIKEKRKSLLTLITFMMIEKNS